MLLILTLAAAAFAPTLAGSFHLDDYSILTDPVLTSPAGGWQVWRPAQVRPLAYFTLWLNHRISGADPWSYHALNWLLHLANVVLAWTALRRLAPERVALVAAGLFALHPVQTETVAYVFARSTLLCAGFCLASLAAWLRGKHWLAAALHFLALLAKEEAVAWPLVLALLHFSISRNHREWRPIAAMAAASVAIGARGLFITSTQAGTGAVASAGYSPLEYFSAQPYVLLRYLRELALPIGLNFDPEISPGYLALWVVWVAAAVWALRHFQQAGPGFWFLAALAILAPTSTFLPINDLSADRRLYLTLVAAAMAVSPWLVRMPNAVLIAGALLLAGLTGQRSVVWQSEESLWRDTVAKSPGKLRPRLQLARAVDPEEGLRLLKGRTEAAALAEQGRLYLTLNQPALALNFFGQALAEEPANPAALANRGTALAMLGQREAAIADFERALAVDPCFGPARENLGKLGAAQALPPCPAAIR